MKKTVLLFLIATMICQFCLTACEKAPEGNDSYVENPTHSQEQNNENKTEDFVGKELSPEKLEFALECALKKIDYAIPTFTDRFPAHSSRNNIYGAVKNNSGWNQGFWTGIL